MSNIRSLTGVNNLAFCYANFHIPHKLTYLYTFFQHVFAYIFGFFMCKHLECLLKNWHIMYQKKQVSAVLVWKQIVSMGTHSIYEMAHHKSLCRIIGAYIEQRYTENVQNTNIIYNYIYKEPHIHGYCILKHLCSVTHVKSHACSSHVEIETLSFFSWGIQSTPGGPLHKQISLYNWQTHNNINAKNSALTMFNKI